MTIDEAIKLLNKDIDDPGSVDIMNVNKAEELAIEALKRLEAIRLRDPIEALTKLPGETED